jgi:hypothetical protein
MTMKLNIHRHGLLKGHGRLDDDTVRNGGRDKNLFAPRVLDFMQPQLNNFRSYLPIPPPPFHTLHHSLPRGVFCFSLYFQLHSAFSLVNNHSLPPSGNYRTREIYVQIISIFRSECIDWATYSERGIAESTAQFSSMEVKWAKRQATQINLHNDNQGIN